MLFKMSFLGFIGCVFVCAVTEVVEFSVPLLVRCTFCSFEWVCLGVRLEYKFQCTAWWFPHSAGSVLQAKGISSFPSPGGIGLDFVLAFTSVQTRGACFALVFFRSAS